ncbi:hypothetical protein ACWEP2_21425, partial [Streptomyces sp. NPDC004279]
MFDKLLESTARADEPHVLDPAVQGPDTHGLGVVVPAQTPVVKGVRGVRAEDDRLGLRLLPALGMLGTEVPGLDVGPQRRVSVGHTLDDVLRGLCPEPTGFELAVTPIPQLTHAALELEVLEGHGGYPVRGLVDRGQGALKCRSLHGIRHPASGISFTCVTIFAGTIVALTCVTTPGTKP